MTHSRAPLVLFVAALIVRLGWVLLAGSDALTYSDDARADHDLAVNLVQRHQFVTTIDPPHRLDVPYAQRPPLTPFALVAAIFGGPLYLLYRVTSGGSRSAPGSGDEDDDEALTADRPLGALAIALAGTGAAPCGSIHAVRRPCSSKVAKTWIQYQP